MKDFALLLLRLAFGGLMAGHGAQKLFGWFGGGGIKGTQGMMQHMGMKPEKPWAILAGASEFGGGALTALGLLSPVGTLGTIGAMSMATAKAHWGKPIWNTAGGAELPVLNMAAALALGMLGPGKLSLDNAIGVRLPRRLLLIPGLAVTAASVAFGVMSSNKAQAKAQQAPKMEEAQAHPDEQLSAVPVPDAPSQDEGERLHEILNETGVEHLTDELMQIRENPTQI